MDFLVLLSSRSCVRGGLLSSDDRPRLRLVYVLAAGIQLVPLPSPLLLSTDAWTYWGYGRIAAEGGNPYVDLPEAFPANPALPYIGAAWTDTTTVYGPAFTLLSEPVAVVAGRSSDAAAWVFKARQPRPRMRRCPGRGRPRGPRRASRRRSSVGTPPRGAPGRRRPQRALGRAPVRPPRHSRRNRRLQGAGGDVGARVARQVGACRVPRAPGDQARARAAPRGTGGFAAASVAAIVGASRPGVTGSSGSRDLPPGRQRGAARRATRSRTGSSSSGSPRPRPGDRRRCARVGLAWLAREAVAAGPASARSVPDPRHHAVPGRLVPGVGRPFGRRRRGRRRTGGLPRAVRLPAASDDSALGAQRRCSTITPSSSARHASGGRRRPSRTSSGISRRDRAHPR